MCKLCGCEKYIDAGKNAVVKRATEIVNKYGVTSRNVQLFEDCERISHDLVSYAFPSYGNSETLEIANWVHGLHEAIFEKRFLEGLKATEDVFNRLPVKGNIKETVTAFHQLEQLTKQIDEKTLCSIKNKKVKNVLAAVKTVHNNNRMWKDKLLRRYKLQ